MVWEWVFLARVRVHNCKVLTMERGRDGRRGGAGGGSLSAPRRPRTSGFKDAPVGEDGDDMTDEIHNLRMRERPKKESNSVNAVLGNTSGNSGSSSRNKRKRMGSQEFQGQARSITADDLDETTEDTEMGVSEDDDDPPPPPIPRRPVKVRPQGKLVEDGSTSDLPAVPRKTRTAILKRPQELFSPTVFDISHQGSSAVSGTPPQASSLCSSAVVSTNVGRRTKPSGSKHRGTKVFKVSTPIASEQEVEVAEALFDLARMFSTQPTSLPEISLELQKPDPKSKTNPKIEPIAEPILNWEPDVLASSIFFPTSLFPSTSISTIAEFTAGSSSVTSMQTPTLAHAASLPLPLGVMPLQCFPALGTVAVPVAVVSPSLVTPTLSTPVTASPAEAPKRKRPRVRTRLDEVGFPSHVGLPGNGSAIISQSCRITSLPIKPDPEQVLPIPPKAEGGKSACAVSIVAQISTTMCPCVPLVLDPMDCSSPGAGHIFHLIEGKAVPLEVEASKVNINNKSAMHDKKHFPQQERNITSASVPARSEMIMEAELPSNSISRHGAPELERGELAIQRHIACGGSGPEIFDIDLMAPPSIKRALLSAVEKAPECSQNPVKGLPKKGSMNIDEGKVREEQKGDVQQLDRECEGERMNEKETEPEVEINSEQLRGQEDQTESSKDTVGEKDQERAELVKPERPGSRVQRVGRAASMISTTLPLLSTCPPFASHVATSVKPMPVEMSGWPVGLQPMGFYSSAAAAGSCWPGTSAHVAPSSADDNSSGVQLQQPYIIQTHQPQPWKRCASHVYIAHFIDVQQQMHRHPFMQAAYQNSASLYGAKPYNLNIPLPHADTLLGNSPGGPLMSGVTGVRMITGCGNGSALGIVPGSGRQLGPLSLVGNSQMKDRAYGEVLSWNQVAQKQPKQLCPTLSLQADLGFTFPAAQTAASATCGIVGAAPVNGGSVGFSASGGGSVIACTGSACGSTIVGSGASSAVASHSAAQAQYLQAVMHQGSYSFPFQAAVNGPPAYIVPQLGTSFFNNPSYTTHTVLPPSHGQLVQKYPHVSGGSMSTQRQQQLAVHNFTPCCPQEQSSLASPSQLSSHAQHQHGTMSHQMQHAGEREGSNGGGNNSTLEGNPSTLLRTVIDQGVLNATVDSIHPPVSLVIGVRSLPPPDFNLMCTLGAKQAKQPQPGQLASQQQQLASQHHAIEHALQMSLKGIDQQFSRAVTAMAVGTMTRPLVIGPGPLGLAPVAAVMAPQGHAMLQSIADPSRGLVQYQQSQHHLSVSGLSHQQSLQLGQKQAEHQGPVLQRVSSDIGVCEESRLGLDGNSVVSRCGREVAEDKKVSAKQGMGSTSLSRVDPDNLTSIQGSSCGIVVSRMIGSVGPTLNLMAPASAVLISCPSVQVVESDLQHSCPKEVPPQGKLLAASIGAALGPTSQSHLSFSDRASLGPSMCSKSPGPSLSLSGQYVDLPSSAPQHSQLKLSIRGALGSLPTASGITPQTMLAAAVVKSKQGPHQQQARMQAQAETNAGTLVRIPAVDSGGSHSSMGIPLPPLPPVSKTNPSNSSKSISAGKNSFPNPHKPSNGVPSKRSTPPSVFVPHVSSISCPSPLVQNPASQNHHPLQSSFQLQQQNVSQYHVQPLKSPQQPSLPPTSQLCLPQSLTATQYHQVHNKHMIMQHQQTQQIQRNVFSQSPAFQQLQQAPGSPLNAHTLLHQKSSASSPQVQVRSSSPLILSQQQSQQSHYRQQYSVQNGPGVFSGPASRGNLSLGHPTLSLGTGSIGNSSSSMSSSPDKLGVCQSPSSRPSLATSKVTCGLGTSTFNLQRNQRSGQSFLHSQFGSKLPSSQQQPQIIAALQNSQAFANSGACGNATEQTTSDATGQEQVNGTRILPSSCPLHLPQMSAVFQPVSMRSPTGVQSAVDSNVEGTGTWCSSMLSVSPSLSSSNCLPNSYVHCNSGAANTSGLSPNLRSCSDGTPLFGVSSSVINQATITGQSHSGSTHQSSFSMTSRTASSATLSVGQSSKGLIQP